MRRGFIARFALQYCVLFTCMMADVAGKLLFCEAVACPFGQKMQGVALLGFGDQWPAVLCDRFLHSLVVSHCNGSDQDCPPTASSAPLRIVTVVGLAVTA